MGRKITNKGSEPEDPRIEHLWFLMRMAVYNAACEKLDVDVLPDEPSSELIARLKRIPGVVGEIPFLPSRRKS